MFIPNGKQLASLPEIEQIVAEARRQDAEGKLETSRYRKQLARLSDAVMERVTQARNRYADLLRIAEAERGRRTAAKRWGVWPGGKYQPVFSN